MIVDAKMQKTTEKKHLTAVGQGLLVVSTKLWNPLSIYGYENTYVGEQREGHGRTVTVACTS